MGRLLSELYLGAPAHTGDNGTAEPAEQWEQHVHKNQNSEMVVNIKRVERKTCVPTTCASGQADKNQSVMKLKHLSK